MSTGGSTIRQSWERFLIDIELAKNYGGVAVLGQIGGFPPPPNPLLDVLLPSLLYVRLGSILAEALTEYIDSNSLPFGKPYRNDFNGRISFLAAGSHLRDAAKLHAIRDRRNELAHETTVYNPSLPTACNWPEVDQAANDGNAELEHLGFVGGRPEYRFWAGQESLSEPGRMTHDYVYCILLNGKAVFKVSRPVSGIR
jgi:hypothetical protein